ncbi:MAG: hypothetical protein L3K17_05890 [Thermoplasmata archaeon]|nr:hypothetical protein [Thermoplasmata archaeon]
MTYSTLKLCSNRGAFEATPEPRLHLDLAAIARRLRSAGIAVTDAKVMLLIQLQRETTLSHDGRVLIKCHDPLEAAQIFSELQRLAELPEDHAEPTAHAPIPSSVIRP